MVKAIWHHPRTLRKWGSWSATIGESDSTSTGCWTFEAYLSEAAVQAPSSTVKPYQYERDRSRLVGVCLQTR